MSKMEWFKAMDQWTDRHPALSWSAVGALALLAVGLICKHQAVINFIAHWLGGAR